MLRRDGIVQSLKAADVGNATLYVPPTIEIVYYLPSDILTGSPEVGGEWPRDVQTTQFG
jgi:hypothetical protein